jgi:hypothetical protein
MATAVMVSALFMMIPVHAIAARLSFDGVTLKSGWKKNATYTTKMDSDDKGSLFIEGGEADPDTDSINIGTIFNSGTGGKKFLVLTVENIEGDFHYGGKVLGLSLSTQKFPNYEVAKQNASFIAPAGYFMDDNFINASFHKGMKLYYDISNLGDLIQIGAKIYVFNGANTKISFNFSDEIQ